MEMERQEEISELDVLQEFKRKLGYELALNSPTPTHGHRRTRSRSRSNSTSSTSATTATSTSAGMVAFSIAAQNFAIGATASAIGATAVYPVDLVKTRLQNQRGRPDSAAGIKNVGAWRTFRNVVAQEGVAGLYKGLIPQLVGQVPEKAMRLFVVESVRNMFPNSRDNTGLNLQAELVAGLCAGTTQVMITNPAEIVKVRMQVQGEEIAKARIAASSKGLPVPVIQQKGMAQHLRELGVKGAYKGATACFLRDIPFSGIYFSSYALFKEAVKQGQEPLRSADLLLCASAAGIAAASVTTPADVLKTRMQVEAKKGADTYTSLLDCYRKVTKAEGHAALFKGLVPRVLRSSPQYGVMLLSYDLLQRVVQGDNQTTTTSNLGNKDAALPSTRNTNQEQRWTKMLLLEDKMGFILENRWQPPASFTKFGGAFKHLSMGGGDSIWAISLNEEPYQWTGTSWVKTSPTIKLKQLSAGNDGTVWGVDRNGRAVVWDSDSESWGYAPLSDGFSFQHISVGAENDIWAILNSPSSTSSSFSTSTSPSLSNAEPNIVAWDGEKWKKIGEERMKYISAGNDGAVWAVNNEGFTFRMRRDKLQWKQMPGSLKQVSVGSARHVWGVDGNDVVYKWTGGEWNGRWVRTGQSAPGQHISVGGDGTLASASVSSSSTL